MASSIIIALASLVLFNQTAIADSHGSTPEWDHLSDLENETEDTSEAGFNYQLALDELNEQVRQGKIPPEAVGDVLDSIAPILQRLDEQGEQIQDLSAKAAQDGNVKLVVKTIRDEDEAGEKNLQSGGSGATSALPPIPKENQAAANPAPTNNSSAGPGLAISIGGGMGAPIGSQRSETFQPNWLAKTESAAYNSPKKDAIRTRTNAGESGSSGGGSTTLSGSNGGPAAAEVANAVGPWASISQLLAPNPKGKKKTARKDGEVRRLVASALTKLNHKGGADSRGLASVSGSSALESPKLSSRSKLLEIPSEYLEPITAQAGEPIPQRPDILGWIFGLLLSGLSVRAWLQWRRARS